MSEFLYMGGYARFVWPSYGLTLAVMLLNILWARRALTRAATDARRRLTMRGKPS